MQKYLKHHYVPRCLFRPWEDAERKVWIYERKNDKVLPPYRQSSKVICVEKGLYSYSNHVAEDRRNIIEKNFFSTIDGSASLILNKFIAGNPDLTADERNLFSIFLASLRIRTPEFFKAQALEGEEKFRKILSDDSDMKPEDKALLQGKTLLEFAENTFPALVSNYPKEIIIKTLSGKLSERVYNSEWIVKNSGDCDIDLLLSDRPLILANGSKEGEFLFGLPISPKHIFFASNMLDSLDKIRDAKTKDLVRNMNISVVQQAKNKAFAKSQNHEIRFFENRLGSFHHILPFANMMNQ